MSFRLACDAPGCAVVCDPGASHHLMPKGWTNMIVGEDELEYHFCPKHKVPVKVRPKRREYLYGRRRRRR